MSLLNQRVKDCADAQVVVDTPRYLQGREQGLVSYCRVDNAIPQGLQGHVYQGVCPAFIEPEFRRRHRAGLDVYNARNSLRDLDTRRRSLEHRLFDAANDDERRRARDALYGMDLDLQRARDRLREVEYWLDRMR
jgi:hypothetical protein